jgi:hypothetical protein
MRLAAALLGLICLGAGPALAQDGDWSGAYGGVSLGYGELGDAGGADVSGYTYGAHAGYAYDFGVIVLGGELDIVGGDIGGVVGTLDDPSGTLFRMDIDSIARAKLRLGYDAGDLQPYATFGAAQMTTSGDIGDSDTGYFYGAGLDYQVGDRFRIGGEVLRHEFDDFADSGTDLSVTTLGARVTFDF